MRCPMEQTCSGHTRSEAGAYQQAMNLAYESHDVVCKNGLCSLGKGWCVRTFYTQCFYLVSDRVTSTESRKMNCAVLCSVFDFPDSTFCLFALHCLSTIS